MKKSNRALELIDGVIVAGKNITNEVVSNRDRDEEIEKTPAVNRENTTQEK